MASLAEFLSMPLSGGPNARPFGVDELGNTAFRGVLGPDYRVVQQAPNRESVVRGLLSQIMDAPGATLANLAKGAAQGTWDAISAPGRSWSDSTMTYGDVANTAGLVSLPAVAGKYDPAVANMGLRAYHGSPHDYAAERLVRMPDGSAQYIVGKPDVLPDVPPGAEVIKDFPLGRARLDKVGTGEGAQAYGHGWYSAEAEDVAKGYRDDLSDPSNFPLRINDEPLNTVWNDELRERFPTMYQGLSEDDAMAMDGILGTLQGVSDTRQALDVVKYSMPKEWQKLAYRRVVPELKAPQIGPGRMYEVDINADPNDFLDWDAPLSEQSPKVKSFAEQRYNQVFGRPPGPDVDGEMIKRIASPQNDLDGREWLDIGPAADASKRLKEAGIPGIKYYDQGSRASGQGTRNYVVFDDSLIEILRKYGLAGAMLGFGAYPQENSQ